VLVKLLTVLGPIELEETPDPIDSKNVISYIRAAKEWTPDRGDEKSSLNKIAGAMLDRLLTGNIELDRLVIILVQLMNERHIILQIDNPQLSDFVARQGWDGSLKPGEGDFLMVVDSNIGFNKTNKLVETNLAYEVDLTDLANPISKLTVVHVNKADSNVPCIQWGGITLEGQENYPIDRCYWDYLRVYLTAGTRLGNANPQDIPADWMIRRVAVPAKVDVLEEGIEGVQAFGVL
jgi:hypothetical protein